MPHGGHAPVRFVPVFPINAPNLLTLLRILLVPVLVVALLDETPNGDLLAAIVFAVASLTDAIDGYTDSKGSPAYNLRLSRRRAAAVRTALARLVGRGVRFQVAGHGEANPVAANFKRDGSDNPRGRAKNRRVTISFR